MERIPLAARSKMSSTPFPAYLSALSGKNSPFPRQQIKLMTTKARATTIAIAGHTQPEADRVVIIGVGPTPRQRWRYLLAHLLRMDTPGEKEGGIVHNIRLALPHVLLCSSTIAYNVFGAMVFERLEHPFEVMHLQKHSMAVLHAQVLRQFVTNLPPEEANATLGAAVDELIRVSMEAFEEGIQASELRGYANSSAKWNFHSSLFFTATLLTSIGYGNLGLTVAVPISPLGRLFCVLYGFLGIPLTLMAIADVAKFFADIILRAEEWLTERTSGSNKRTIELKPVVECKTRRMSMAVAAMDQQGAHPLRQANSFTKLFVLCLLLGYMLAMAVLFSRLQQGWGLLESLYFTLITLVTIGFGDFCPPADREGEAHYAGWILFIFVGLTLSTLTVDLVGSSYIDRIHTLGRGFHLGSFLTMLRLGRGNCPDSERLLRQLNAGAYIPPDAQLIPYIDLFATRSSNDTLANGNGATMLPDKPHLQQRRKRSECREAK